MKYVALLNSEGGTLKTSDASAVGAGWKRVLEGRGHSVEIRIVKAGELNAALQELVDHSDADVVMVAGGDGTVSSAASILTGTQKALAIVPGGTMNLFARSLKLSMDMDEAVVQIASGRAKNVDIASANGRRFVHHYSVGLHPQAMRLRSRHSHSSRYGKILASLWALLATIRRPRRFRAGIILDDSNHVQGRLSAIAVTNNPFEDSHLPYSDDPTSGYLGVYLVNELTTMSAFKLMFEIFAGGWMENDSLFATSACKASLQIHRASRYAKASVDGELVPLDRTVKIEIHPKALTVIVPSETR